MRAYFAGMEEKYELSADDEAGFARIGGLQDVTIDPKTIPESWTGTPDWRRWTSRTSKRC